MNKKGLIFLLAFPIVLHLCNLFFLHFRAESSPNRCVHRFRKEFTTPVEGLDTSTLDAILSQPFHYLGQGKQMVAYESEDGKVVLKLFNPMSPLKKGWYTRWTLWKRYSSLKWFSREWLSQKERLFKLFKRHKIAFEHLQDETGLLYVHLSPSEKITHYLHLTDQHGKKHILPLENTPFVLQEKAVPVPTYLTQLLNNHEIEKAALAIGRLEALFEKRTELGITDRIQTMHNNYGFVGDKPIQIDVGRIHMNEELIPDKEAEKRRLNESLHSWVSAHFPQLFEEHKAICSDLINEPLPSLGKNQ